MASTETAALTLEQVTLSRDRRPVLRGVDLAVPAGEVWALMGVSGAGKSTVLRAAVALEAFDGGRIQVGDVSLVPGRVPPESQLRALRRRVGMVFQQHALFAHLSALENVTLAPVHTGVATPQAARATALRLLESLGVGHRTDAYPAQLSGGEAQRVAIARALALDPQVLLMDEPTAALDPARRVALTETLRQLAQGGRTLLITTHDLGFARTVADRVAVLSHGVVVECGEAKQVLDSPVHEATKELLKSETSSAAT
ncbi:MAG TPA: ATP-binding cassette domain-containing protein [Gemmatimonas sp.]|uniref:amino acid ABC transporter ATP-binding protein n=1 Tax=Gemmatimonas sp. TaxID=1962908 RepID=UPI002EDA7BD4